MPELTSAWISLEKQLALSWWAWYQWFIGDQASPEPDLSEWDKKAIRKLVDIEFSFRAFKEASGGGKQWRMLSVVNVTHQQIQAGYNQHGDAHAGGNFECTGFWHWSPGDSYCVRDETFGWHPSQVLKFMPDSCGGVLCDATLVTGQPPRDLS